MRRELKITFDGTEGRMTLDEIAPSGTPTALIDLVLSPAEIGYLDNALNDAIKRIKTQRADAHRNSPKRILIHEGDDK